MDIVVDTNIVFSAVLNSSGKIGQLITLGNRFFDFYSVDLLKAELEENKGKLERISNLTSKEIEANIEMLYGRIKFIDTIVLSEREVKTAMELTQGIDINDTLFVALASHLNCKLWTGDTKLAKGLNRKGLEITISTLDLYQVYKETQR